MMSFNEHDARPGLEVAQEPSLIVDEKQYAGQAQYAYEQQAPAFQSTLYPNHIYPNGVYSPLGYPAQGHPTITPHGQPPYGSSEDGSYITNKMPPVPVPPSGRRILGLRPKTFWLVVGPLCALIVIGLAVGLGVGLANSHHDSNTAPHAPPTSPPTPGASTASAHITCPGANGTVHEGAGNGRFLIICDVDYNGNAEGSKTRDIGSETTSSFEGCIDVCARNSSCVGAGWGDYYGDNICWMKGALGESRGASNWYFAIRE